MGMKNLKEKIKIRSEKKTRKKKKKKKNLKKEKKENKMFFCDVKGEWRCLWVLSRMSDNLK